MQLQKKMYIDLTLTRKFDDLTVAMQIIAVYIFFKQLKLGSVNIEFIIKKYLSNFEIL